MWFHFEQKRCNQCIWSLVISWHATWIIPPCYLISMVNTSQLRFGCNSHTFLIEKLTIDAIIFFMMQTLCPVSFVSCHLFWSSTYKLFIWTFSWSVWYQQKIYFSFAKWDKTEWQHMSLLRIRISDLDFDERLSYQSYDLLLTEELRAGIRTRLNLTKFSNCLISGN